MSSLVYGEQGAFLCAVVSFHSGSVSKAGLKRNLIDLQLVPLKCPFH